MAEDRLLKGSLWPLLSRGNVWSFVVMLVLVTLSQLIFHDASPLLLQLHSSSQFLSSFSPYPFSLTPFFSSSPQLNIAEPVCPNYSPFPISAPISKALTMGLAEHTTRIVSDFEFSDSDVNRHVGEFLRQMNEGLQKDGTSMSQIPSYVTAVPNGTEKGLYLAVDLGGTNFRVCSVMLNGDTTFDMTCNKVAIPKELMVAKTVKDLFAFLAKQIELFLREHHAEHFESHIHRRNTFSTPQGFVDETIFRLGFTFSFPVQQLGINKGRLIRWTKGFDIPDAVGQDVCELLQTEIDRLGLPVKVAALVNDTVGTLMARSYTSTGRQSLLGAIFGTGTNGAYVEAAGNIKKPIKGDYNESFHEMVINTEWGSFDNQLNVLPSTAWDQALDKQSINPGIQMYEKRVSGMFLGEIVRLALVDMIQNEETHLFGDVNSSFNEWAVPASPINPKSLILQPWSLDTAVLSVAAADNTPELSNIRQELEGLLHAYTPSLEDAQAFKSVASAVVRRAARLSAVAIGAIVLQSGKLGDPTEEVIDIGVDGSLVEHYPLFRDMIYEGLQSIEAIGPEGADRIRIGIAKDGSGVGAALIALIASNMEKPGDFLRDLRRDIRRRLSLSARSDSGESTLLSTSALAIGAIVGVSAIAALWWSRTRR